MIKDTWASFLTWSFAITVIIFVAVLIFVPSGDRSPKGLAIGFVSLFGLTALVINIIQVILSKVK